jgi:hypothetical protein
MLGILTVCEMNLVAIGLIKNIFLSSFCSSVAYGIWHPEEGGMPSNTAEHLMMEFHSTILTLLPHGDATKGISTIDMQQQLRYSSM